MKFIIHRQTKSSMQSGKKNCQKWLMQPIETFNNRHIENTMHWISNSDTSTQLKFEFSSQQEALDFAIANKYEFELIVPNEPKIKPKSYSDNFTN